MKKFTLMVFAAAAFALASCGKNEDTPSQLPKAADVSQRMDYFASHGWEVEEISEKDILIPSEERGVKMYPMQSFTPMR